MKWGLGLLAMFEELGPQDPTAQDVQQHVMYRTKLRNNRGIDAEAVFEP